MQQAFFYRSIMSEDPSSELYSQLLRRNHRNLKVIASFLKTANHRYARKINMQAVEPNFKSPLQLPPPIPPKHSPTLHISESFQNMPTSSSQSKNVECAHVQTYHSNKQGKQEMRSLLKFVRESRESKLKFYSGHSKKENIVEGKSITRTPLHLKNIVFFGEGYNRLQIRRNKSIKSNLGILPLIGPEKHNSSLHGCMVGNA